jgi:hypothetical protein
MNPFRHFPYQVCCSKRSYIDEEAKRKEYYFYCIFNVAYCAREEVVIAVTFGFIFFLTSALFVLFKRCMISFFLSPHFFVPPNFRRRRRRWRLQPRRRRRQCLSTAIKSSPRANYSYREKTLKRFPGGKCIFFPSKDPLSSLKDEENAGLFSFSEAIRVGGSPISLGGLEAKLVLELEA